MLCQWIARLLLSVTVLVIPAGHAAHAAETALSAAIIRGASVYSPLQLLPAYQLSLGQPISQSRAQTIIAAIEALYVRDGYARPELQVDVSQSQLGILSFDVFEARITAIQISGDPGPYRQRMDALGSRLQSQQPLQTAALQDYVRRMSELPGLRVAVGTRRDQSVRNGFVVVVDAHFSVLQTTLRFTNRGTRDVGPDFVIGQTAFNGLLGRDLKAGLVFGLAADTREFRGAGLFVDAPLTGEYTRANLLAFRSFSSPTEHPVDFDVDYLHNRATADITHRWPSRGALDLSTSGTLELDDQFINSGSLQLQADRMRIVDLTAQLAWHNADATQYVTMLSLRQGLNALGAGLLTGGIVDPRRSSDFSNLRLQFIRVAQLRTLWQWRIDVLGQYSGDVLADRERYKIGGDRLGRGFEVPAIIGDQGLGTKLELRRSLPRLSTPVGDLSAYGSYDIGVTRTNDLHQQQSAATAAIGAGLQGKLFSGYVELARPLTHPDIDGRRSTTLFVDLTASF